MEIIMAEAKRRQIAGISPGSTIIDAERVGSIDRRYGPADRGWHPRRLARGDLPPLVDRQLAADEGGVDCVGNGDAIFLLRHRWRSRTMARSQSEGCPVGQPASHQIPLHRGTAVPSRLWRGACPAYGAHSRVPDGHWAANWPQGASAVSRRRAHRRGALPNNLPKLRHAGEQRGRRELKCQLVSRAREMTGRWCVRNGRIPIGLEDAVVARWQKTCH